MNHRINSRLGSLNATECVIYSLNFADIQKKGWINANELRARDAEGVILGCTEIPLLIEQNEFSYPVFDTTKIHVESILDYTLDTSDY